MAQAAAAAGLIPALTMTTLASGALDMYAIAMRSPMIGRPRIPRRPPTARAQYITNRLGLPAASRRMIKSWRLVPMDDGFNLGRAGQRMSDGRRKWGEFLLWVAFMYVMQGAAEACNALALTRHPPSAVTCMGHFAVGILLAVVSGLVLRNFSRPAGMLPLALSFVILLFGSVRLLKLAFGVPWSLFNSAALIPLAATLVGGVAVCFTFPLTVRQAR
jgi:hypothetical protein